jgi:ADP-heptose:LPS heptosyltransferase
VIAREATPVLRPEVWAGVRRLLAVRVDNIGDVVLLGPALHALREALPQAQITLMASPAGSLAAPLLPWIDDVIVQRTLWQDASGALPFDPSREQALIDDLRRRRFDAALVFTSFSQTPFPAAYACYLAGIPIRVGHSSLFGGRVLSHQADPPPAETQQGERNLHLLESAGIPVGRRDLEVHIPPEAERAAAALLDESGLAGRDFVAVAPGASADARRYPASRFGLTARAIARETGLAVVVVGSERDASLADEVLAGLGGVPAVSLAGRTDVPALAALIGRSRLVLANNSLALHLADATRTPVVATYSGTDLEGQWRPRSTASVLLRRPTPCSPCYGFTCPFDLECLDIPPAEVAAAACRLLDRAAVPAGTGEGA